MSQLAIVRRDAWGRPVLDNSRPEYRTPPRVTLEKAHLEGGRLTIEVTGRIAGNSVQIWAADAESWDRPKAGFVNVGMFSSFGVGQAELERLGIGNGSMVGIRQISPAGMSSEAARFSVEALHAHHQRVRDAVSKGIDPTVVGGSHYRYRY